MSRAATTATMPRRRCASSSPAATAPAMTAWSEGNEKSVVMSARRRMAGWAAYGRASGPVVDRDEESVVEGTERVHGAAGPSSDEWWDAVGISTRTVVPVEV